MTHSMTGFAAGTRDTEHGRLSIELRTLNHRYSEVFVRLPEELRTAEASLRELAATRIRRGKLEISVRFRPVAGAAVELAFNQRLGRRLAELAREARAVFEDAPPTDIAGWLAWPGMVEAPEPDLASVQEALLAVAAKALDELVAHRSREGEKLAGQLLQRLDEITGIVARVRGWLPDIRSRASERLRERVDQLSEIQVDRGRLEQEVALVLQRLDVDEELDRLETHVAEVRRTIAAPKPKGRRLDFLMQELNREANTLGSKTVDARLGQASVDLKVLIEQMREQVQNIE